MRNENLPMTMDLQQKLIFFALLIFCLSGCAPRKVWYQEDIQDSMMKSDLETCRSGVGDEEALALCMQSKGFQVTAKILFILLSWPYKEKEKYPWNF